MPFPPMAAPVTPPVSPPEPPPSELSAGSRALCAAIWQMTEEMMVLTAGAPEERRDRRRSVAHARQIAMYVCHVIFGLTMTELGRAFGRDRSTVGHACHVVEDRRDDPGYDGFVSALERVAQRLVEPAPRGIHG